MKTSEVLDRAADKIARDGWCRYNISQDGRLTCARGALFYGAGYYYCGGIDIDKKAAAVAAEIPLRAAVGRVPSWNDAPGRTKEEVIAMLRAVAATERARESRLMPMITESVPA